MNILLASSEAFPYSKSGGLADVMGALPAWLGRSKNKVNLVLPLHASSRRKFILKMKKMAEFEVQINWRKQYCGLWKIEEKNFTVIFVENDYYFNRDNLYGYFDDGERYIFFSKAIAGLIPFLEEKPDIVHCHDWQTAAATIYIKDIKKVFTIHNLNYQGRFSRDVFDQLLDLPQEYFNSQALEYYGDLNLMKGAIVFADHLTTVSPNYSREIRTAYFGEGLQDLLEANSYKLTGILNGLDYNEYNPYTDRALYYNYKSSLELKAKNKERLQEEVKLEKDRTKPLLTMVSRFTEQKGLDLLLYIMRNLLEREIQLIVHGNGDKYYEDQLSSFAADYPHNYRLLLGFQEDMARKIYAGGDIFLMPSRFEPCGLSQMIAMRYGNIPLVREAGGLKDTVFPYNEFSREGNGFSFANYNGEEFLQTIDYSLEIFAQKERWKELYKSALKTRYSWEKSASQYLEIYKKLLSR